MSTQQPNPPGPSSPPASAPTTGTNGTIASNGSVAPAPPAPAPPVLLPPKVDQTPTSRRNGTPAKASWWDRLRNFAANNVVWPVTLAVGVGVILFVFFHVVSLPRWQGQNRAFASTMHAIGYAVPCVLPIFLSLVAALLMRHSRRARLEQAAFPAHTAATVAAEHPAAYAAALEDWDTERELAVTGGDRTINYGMVHGLLGTLVFGGVVWVVGERLIWTETAMSPARYAGALGVGAVVAVSSLKDFARMMVRAAARDGSDRLFAWASRRLILCILSMLGIVAIAHLGLLEQIGTGEPNAYSWFALGIVVALVGERALDLIADKISVWLGMAPLKRAATPELMQLDGLNQEEMLRLEEEGIPSLHALVHHSTARLHFVLPFTMREIVDWQDQAAFLARFGAAKATTLRETAQMRRITELWHEAKRFVDRPAGDAVREAIRRRLCLADDLEAEETLRAVLRDGEVLRLVIYRELFLPAVPEKTP